MSRRASNNVSLFPFLAVLVCAMGALILLLLVTTRRIRSDQLAALESQTEAVDSEPLPVVPPMLPVVPIGPEEDPEAASVRADDYADGRSDGGNLDPLRRYRCRGQGRS